MAIDYRRLCSELAGWIGQWEFSAFVTLTNDFTVRRSQLMPSSYELKVNRYLTEVETLLGKEIGAIGISTLSHGGYLHSHFVALTRTGHSFSKEDLQIFERKWNRQADAQEVTRQDSLLEYIASENHLKKCRDFDYLLFGDIVLHEIRRER